MSLEGWKSVFEIGGVVLLFLTFAFGAGALWTARRVNDRQAAQLRQFDKDLTDAKTELGAQQERAATAELRLRQVENTAAGANERAALADQRAAEANQKAAEANEAAERERLARAKIEAVLADRTLSDDQMRQLIAKMAHFPGQEFGIIAYWDSNESAGIANRIAAALQHAQWKIDVPKQFTRLLGGVVGIIVWIHPEADRPAVEAASALVSTLQGDGLQVELRAHRGNPPKDNKISIDVGAKR